MGGSERRKRCDGPFALANVEEGSACAWQPLASLHVDETPHLQSNHPTLFPFFPLFSSDTTIRKITFAGNEGPADANKDGEEGQMPYQGLIEHPKRKQERGIAQREQQKQTHLDIAEK